MVSSRNNRTSSRARDQQAAHSSGSGMAPRNIGVRNLDGGVVLGSRYAALNIEEVDLEVTRHGGGDKNIS